MPIRPTLRVLESSEKGWKLLIEKLFIKIEFGYPPPLPGLGWQLIFVPADDSS